jgi:hypothetical protein
VTAGGFFLDFLADDVVTEINTFITNKDRWARNQFADFVLAFATKGAVKQLAVILRSLFVGHTKTLPLSEVPPCLFFNKLSSWKNVRLEANSGIYANYVFCASG